MIIYVRILYLDVSFFIFLIFFGVNLDFLFIFFDYEVWESFIIFDYSQFLEQSTLMQLKGIRFVFFSCYWIQWGCFQVFFLDNKKDEF